MFSGGSLYTCFLVEHNRVAWNAILSDILNNCADTHCRQSHYWRSTPPLVQKLELEVSESSVVYVEIEIQIVLQFYIVL